MSAAPTARDVRCRRELDASLRIPYTSHVTQHLVRTRAGDFVQVFRLGGGSFQSADDETLNQWHERLNLAWRNIASPQVALWVHIVRRRERMMRMAPTGSGFEKQLARRYQGRLAEEALMVNALYLSVVYRPAAGVTTGLASRILRQRGTAVGQDAASEAIETCEKLAQAILSSLERYDPEHLGMSLRDRRWTSQVLEFFGELINGEATSMPLPRAPRNEVLATSRIVFGTEVIEYRLPTQTRLGAMLGIKEYPTPSVVGMFNALLSAPFSFVLTQSFTCITKAAAQGLLQRQYNRM